MPGSTGQRFALCGFRIVFRGLGWVMAGPSYRLQSCDARCAPGCSGNEFLPALEYSSSSTWSQANEASILSIVAATSRKANAICHRHYRNYRILPSYDLEFSPPPQTP